MLKQVDQLDILNKADPQGFTLLCYVQSTEVLNVLVKKGANIHEISENSFGVKHTPLSSACAFANYPMVESILECYSLSDLEKDPPDYIKKNESLSSIWDSVYEQKQALQSAQEVSSTAIKSEQVENLSKVASPETNPVSSMPASSKLAELSLNDSKQSDFYANNPSASLSTASNLTCANLFSQSRHSDSKQEEQKQEKKKDSKARLHC